MISVNIDNLAVKLCEMKVFSPQLTRIEPRIYKSKNAPERLDGNLF